MRPGEFLSLSIPLGVRAAQREINAALVRLIDVRRVPVHLDSTLALLGTLVAQVRRHLDAEVLLAVLDRRGCWGIVVPLLEVLGDHFAVGRGCVDDGDVRMAGVGGHDCEGQVDRLAGSVGLDVARNVVRYEPCD